MTQRHLCARSLPCPTHRRTILTGTRATLWCHMALNWYVHLILPAVVRGFAMTVRPPCHAHADTHMCAWRVLLLSHSRLTSASRPAQTCETIKTRPMLRQLPHHPWMKTFQPHRVGRAKTKWRVQLVPSSTSPALCVVQYASAPWSWIRLPRLSVCACCCSCNMS